MGRDRGTGVDGTLARHVFRRGVGPAVQRYLGRPFPRGAKTRLLIYYNPAAISFAQVYPFLAHAAGLRRRFGAAVRCLPVEHFLEGRPRDADIVLAGPWFTEPPERLTTAFERLRKRQPELRIGFLDSYAANDLRLGSVVAPHVEWYLKKSLFRDRGLYRTPFRGDTNLTQYYGDLYGMAAHPVDWQVPETLMPKLRLSPNFLTAPQFLHGFPPEGRPPQAGRRLDMQTRLGRRGTPWYQAMRDHSLKAVAALEGVAVSPPDRISYESYMAEMREARLCFSPFGYGELCWRDIEAFQAGAVLIKPDMSHLETLPDLYEPGVTYLPVRWDFADLEEVVRRALSDDALRARIARTAYDRCADYLNGDRFVEDVAFLFD